MRSHQILFWLSLSRIYFHFANINKVDFSVLLNWMKVQLDFISNFQDASRVLTLEHTWAWSEFANSFRLPNFCLYRHFQQRFCCFTQTISKRKIRKCTLFLHFSFLRYNSTKQYTNKNTRSIIKDIGVALKYKYLFEDVLIWWKPKKSISFQK